VGYRDIAHLKGNMMKKLLESRKGTLVIVFLVAGIFMSGVSKTYVLKTPPIQTKELSEYTNIQENYNSTLITDFRGIDTLKIDTGGLAGLGANGQWDWLEAVKIPVPQNNMSIIGLLYYPDNLWGGTPPLSWRIWDDDGIDGGPGTQLLADTVIPQYGSWYYVIVDPPIPIDSGHIFPGWSDDVTLSDPFTILFNGIDEVLDNYNWWYTGSEWVLDDWFPGDFMIRVVVIVTESDVGPVSIDMPTDIYWDTTLIPMATVKNFGDIVETFEVTCEIVPGIPQSTQMVMKLAPGESTQLTYPEFNVSHEDTYTVTVYTSLNEDIDISNDTMILKIAVHDPGIVEENTADFFFFGLKNNPIKNKAIFNLVLPEPTLVSLQIYDISGRLIDRISSRKFIGYNEITWIPKVSGIYFYTVEFLEYKESGKLIVVK
jgi:hypothetical protein